MDAAGEAVLALLRTANQRTERQMSTNHSTECGQGTNGDAERTRPANGKAACPLADWLATNRLASTAVTSLLGAGPGGRRVAHWLIEEATGPVWRDIEENVDHKKVGHVLLYLILLASIDRYSSVYCLFSFCWLQSHC